MIPSRGVDSTAKNTQTDWDLTSSVTGTVKRRPVSLESCKSNPSPTKTENIDFPRRSNVNEEVAGGSTPKRSLGKLAESAKKSFSSKLKLPNRVSLTVRKSSANNKLSLSQLEQQNNLFIRDGQQQQSEIVSVRADVGDVEVLVGDFRGSRRIKMNLGNEELS
jgi:hypothetical protein